MRVPLLSIGVTVALMSAFGSTAWTRPLDPISAEEIEARFGELHHVPWDGKSVEKDVKTTWSGCVKSTLELSVVDPATGGVRVMALKVSRPDVEAKVPVVVIVPTIEGTTPLEPEIAATLCGNYIASIIAEVSDNTQPEQMPAWGLEDRRNRDSILAIRTILDYAQNNSRFDGEKLGIMGLSQGGITTSMLASLESERLRAVVIAVAGGNMPYILANSNTEAVSVLRERRMKHLGLKTLEQYEEALRDTIQFDPIYFAPRVQKDRILMVMAEKDDKVPTVVQKEQFMAFGQPDQIVFSGGHVMTLISLVYWHMDSVVDFFYSRFDLKEGEVPGRRIRKYIQIQED